MINAHKVASSLTSTCSFWCYTVLSNIVWLCWSRQASLNSSCGIREMLITKILVNMKKMGSDDNPQIILFFSDINTSHLKEILKLIWLRLPPRKKLFSVILQSLSIMNRFSYFSFVLQIFRFVLWIHKLQNLWCLTPSRPVHFKMLY